MLSRRSSVLNISIKILSPIFVSKFHINHIVNQRINEEIKIPVPWGLIAGKWWGPKDKRPILGVHGWQDNCGTFDTLVHHLPSDIPLLAIDLPGHGYSSQIPPGIFYNGFDLVILFRRIFNYFQWDKISLLGHSLGGLTHYLYASTFPDTVDFIVSFDSITPMTGIGQHVNCEPDIIDKFLLYESLGKKEVEPPSYPYDKLSEILQKGSANSIAWESCKYLLTRNIRQSRSDPSKYYFARDSRIKLQYFMAWYYNKLMKDGHKINCPVMEIQASINTYFSPERLNASPHHNIMDVIRKSSKNFQKYEADGTHYFHLNNPEKTADLVNVFVKKYYTDEPAKKSNNNVRLSQI